MKKAIICALSVICLFPLTASAQEQARVTVDMPNGKSSCLLVNNALVDCVLIEPQREIIQTSSGAMSCILENGSYVDCQMVGDSAVPAEPAVSDAPVEAVPESVPDAIAPEGVSADNANPAEGLAADQAESVPEVAPDEGEAVYSEPIPLEAVAPEDNPAYVPPETVEPVQASEPSYDSSSSGSSHWGYWDNDYDIPNGLTYGMTLGWFGQVCKGSLEENGFSFGFTIGFKYMHFGLSLDMDISVSPTEEKFHDLWTYTFGGGLMLYLPFEDGMAQTFGFGVGYTGWSLDYEYTTHSLAYNWYDGYYVKENNYSTTVDSGGFLSLKLKARLDFFLDDFNMGFEFDWIPWLDTDKNGEIVNNIIGIQWYLGGIL